jgi:hypothetical protein
MPDLQYSAKALDTLRYFHRTRFVVFVEGHEDIPFWTMIFDLGGMEKAYFKLAGGHAELTKYVNAIVVDSADVVVARDADFDDMLGGRVDHPRVLYTFGYAIENTICSDTAIAGALRLFLYSNDDPLPVVHEWIRMLGDTLERMIILDIASRMDNEGVLVPMDNALRFFDRRNRSQISATLVESAAVPIETQIPVSRVVEARARLGASAKPLRYYFRGHCLFSAVLHLVVDSTRRAGRGITLSREALFGVLMSETRNRLKDSGEWAHYERELRRLREAA